MTRPYSPATPLNLEGATVQRPPLLDAAHALPGLRLALAECGAGWKDRIQAFNAETGARFAKLSGRARNFAARMAMCRPACEGMEGYSDIERSARTKSPEVAAGNAWMARHYVSLSLAWSTWGECSDQEWRAECRRVRLQAIRELEEALCGSIRD